MFLRDHMEIALLLLLLMSFPSWLAGDLDGSSGREQRGLFITAIVSSSEHTKAQKNQRRESRIQHQIQEGVA